MVGLLFLLVHLNVEPISLSTSGLSIGATATGISFSTVASRRISSASASRFLKNCFGNCSFKLDLLVSSYQDLLKWNHMFLLESIRPPFSRRISQQKPLYTHALEWKLCKSMKNKSSQVLDVQFGVSRKSLKMVAAYSDGYLRVFELLNLLELKNWQLQAEFQNVIDSLSTLDMGV
ncbi:hypothetical protein ISN44_As06g026620 [Arabidopsis suecica]|uniref:Uncharacterized protein n=1 Tax=Arabidopsis suecica TaxID=45249 RepID=A0A8T2CU37_ARASU|nr:hypothetical protein ISN44_As06g026620 [Arabidopsis suecica]